MKKIGLHIIADIYEYDIELINSQNISKLKTKITLLIHKNGLHEMGNYYKKFGKGAYSGIISLTESHLAFHTWPEIKYISLDIFVCNYSNDNSKKAINLYNDLIEFFNPKKIKVKYLKR
jgi:S-adenosylmethionine decarboxylase proenzyme